MEDIFGSDNDGDSLPSQVPLSDDCLGQGTDDEGMEVESGALDALGDRSQLEDAEEGGRPEGAQIAPEDRRNTRQKLQWRKLPGRPARRSKAASFAAEGVLTWSCRQRSAELWRIGLQPTQYRSQKSSLQGE